MTRPFRRNHQHVDAFGGLDQIEVNVEAVREHDRSTVLDVLDDMVAIDIGLQFVGRQHHHHIGPLRGFGDLHHLELLALGLFDALRTLAQRHNDLFDAGIAQVERMGVALAAIADDGDFLALDQVQVGVAVVVNTHGSYP